MPPTCAAARNTDFGPLRAKNCSHRCLSRQVELRVRAQHQVAVAVAPSAATNGSPDQAAVAGDEDDGVLLIGMRATRDTDRS